MGQVTLLKKEVKGRICRILNLDPKQVRNMTLYLTVDDAIKVDVERYVFDNELEEILLEIQQFELIPTSKDITRIPVPKDNP